MSPPVSTSSMPWWPNVGGGSSSGPRERTTSPGRSPKTYRNGCWTPDSGGGPCAAPVTRPRYMSSMSPPSSAQMQHGCVNARGSTWPTSANCAETDRGPRSSIIERGPLWKGSGGGALLGRLALRTDPTNFDALATGQVCHADPYRCWADHDAPVHETSVHLPFTYCTTDG